MCLFSLNSYCGSPNKILCAMQSVELTNEAVEFLRRIFRIFDIDNVCFPFYLGYSLASFVYEC